MQQDVGADKIRFQQHFLRHQPDHVINRTVPALAEQVCNELTNARNSFDTVPHDELLEKHFHVRCKLKQYIKSFIFLDSYNKFAQITARAVRSSLKEEQRLAAERRGLTTVRFQQWENGLGGQQVWRVLILCWYTVNRYLYRWS